jgi:hypothetical protein
MKVGDKLYYYSDYTNSIEEIVIESITKEETKDGVNVVSINNKSPDMFSVWESSKQELVERLIENETYWYEKRINHFKSLLDDRRTTT